MIIYNILFSKNKANYAKEDAEKFNYNKKVIKISKNYNKKVIKLRENYNKKVIILSEKYNICVIFFKQQTVKILYNKYKLQIKLIKRR